MSNPNANVRMFMGPINAAAYWIGDHLLRGADIVNDSTVTGSTVKAALNTLSAASTAVFPFTASGLAEQDLVSYDAGAATWRNRTIANALKGAGTTSLAIGASAVAAGTSDIVIGNSAGNSANTGQNNIAIGTDTLDSATVAVSDMIAIGNLALTGALTASANRSIAIGRSALATLTTGSLNTAVGSFSQAVMQTGSFNVSVGSGALQTSTNASNIVAIGADALNGLLTSAASGSVGVGVAALYSATTGINTGVGYYNQLAITTGTQNTTVGYNVMSHASTAVATSNMVGVGHSALAGALTAAANGAVAIGVSALTALTSGANNLGVGYQSLKTITTGTNNTAIGYGTLINAAVDLNHSTAVGANAMGSGAAANLITGIVDCDSTAIGSRALFSTQGYRNTAIGRDAASSLTTGSLNFFGGNFSGAALTAAIQGVWLGAYCGYQTSNNVDSVVAIGYNAVSSATLAATASGLVAVGHRAMEALTSGAKNSSLGFQSGIAITTGSRNTLLGYAATSTAGSDDNTFLGDEVGSTSVGSRNTAVGSQAFNSASAAVTDTVSVGYNALTGVISTTAPSGSVAIGSTALQAVTTGLNTAVGFANQLAITTGTGNTTLGYNVMSHASTGVSVSDIVGIGASALAAALTTAANGTVAIGAQALTACTSGTQNVAVGFRGLIAITTGARNTTLGYRVMGETGGANNMQDMVGLGYLVFSSSSLAVGASGAVGVGSGALAALTSGAGTTAVGFAAGNTLTTGSSNTIIGYDADTDSATRAGCVILGRGASGAADDTLVIRMGNTSTKEIVITPVVDGTVPLGAVTYLPITIGGTAYRILLQAP